MCIDVRHVHGMCEPIMTDDSEMMSWSSYVLVEKDMGCKYMARQENCLKLFLS